jgi:hypothetical protein
MAKRRSPADQLDRIKRLALAAMFADDTLMNRLVLKGGNALDLVYNVSMRASVDLDFSMPDAFAPGELTVVRGRMEQRLVEVFGDAGFVCFDVELEEKPAVVSADLAPFWGGYTLTFKLVDTATFDEHAGNFESLRRNAMAVAPGQRRSFEIDISKHEFIGEKHRAEVEGYTVYVYTPTMLACEKLRAICQQMPEYGPIVRRSRPGGGARPRDFLDLCTLLDRCGVDLLKPASRAMLASVFAAKRVPVEFLRLVGSTREAHRQDWPAVEQTVRPGTRLEPFDRYFDRVVALADQLLAEMKPGGT